MKIFSIIFLHFFKFSTLFGPFLFFLFSVWIFLRHSYVLFLSSFISLFFNFISFIYLFLLFSQVLPICGNNFFLISWKFLHIFLFQDCTSTKAKAHKEDDCKSYTECENGKSIHKTCEGSLIFNELTNACDWPQNVICGKSAVEQRSDEVIYKDFEDEVNALTILPIRFTSLRPFFYLSIYICEASLIVSGKRTDIFF